MLDEVKEAFLLEKQHQGTLNKALRRIIRDCNDEQLAKGKKILCYCRIFPAIPCGIHLLHG